MNDIKIVIMAVGGQGNLLASKILGEAAIKAGVDVNISEVHGMAQRGGVVETDVVFGENRSPTVADGEADILLAFDPIEAVRAMKKCHKETLVISNSRPLIPFTVTMGAVPYPDIGKMIEYLTSKVKRVLTIDAVGLAEEAGARIALNMVMLGALAGLGRLPISDEILKDSITGTTKPKFRDMNLKAFELGYDVACRGGKGGKTR